MEEVTISTQGQRVKTLKQLLKHANVDTKKWRVSSWRCNSWEQSVKGGEETITSLSLTASQRTKQGRSPASRVCRAVSADCALHCLSQICS